MNGAILGAIRELVSEQATQTEIFVTYVLPRAGTRLGSWGILQSIISCDVFSAKLKNKTEWKDRVDVNL
jgi:hypothetical protein